MIPVNQFEPAAWATGAGEALVGQTKIADLATGLRAVVAYPVKTMNMNRYSFPTKADGSVWQIDTGSIGAPNLSKHYDPPISAFSLGFIAISRHPVVVDFVIE